MHGLGDTAMGFTELFLSGLNFVDENTRIVLPTAPIRKCTLNMGFKVTSWYDIKSLDKIGNKEENLYDFNEVKDS